MSLLALSLAVSPCFAGEKFKDPDAKKEWYGAGWGYSPREGMDCDPGDFKDALICTRSDGEDRKVGELTAKTVTYRFFEKRMYRVELTFDKDPVIAELGSILRLVYGPGEWNAAEIAESWEGDSVRISFGRNLRAPGGVLVYEYKPLLVDVQAGEKSGGGMRLVEIIKSI